MADDYSINAKITADASGYESGVKKAQEASQNLSKSISGVIQGLGKSGLVGALGAVGLATGGVTAILGTAKKAFQQVSKTVKECTENYRKQYKAEISLKTAVKNNPYVDGSAEKRLKAYASEIQSFSNLGDEEVLPMMSKLIALGREEAEVMKITRVATDMSADGTISFETAVNQLNMTLNGEIGRLGMQNAELKELSEEELKAGKAIDILGNKYKGLAKATADSSVQLKNAIGDFKELMGQSFEKTLAPMRKYFTEVITNLNTTISKAREQKQAFEDVYTDGNLNLNAETENMKTVVVELQKNYEEVYRNFQQYVNLYGKYIDKNTDAIYLAYQRDIKDYEAQIGELTKRIETKKKEAEEEAKRQKDYQESVEMESKIAKLKADHLEALQKQRTEWKNIEIVTGKAVSNEEKLKFYQDDLVKIMSESGGYITENNQYYKDQIKIINELKEQLGLVVETTEEITEETEEVIEVWADLSSDLSRGITEVVKNARQGLYNVQLEISKAKEVVINDFANTVTESFNQMFSMLGENLVGAGYGFEDFASVALNALSEVLKSISAQLSAIAVLKTVTHDYANATIALAGATASMVASGVASQVSKNLTTTKKKIDAVGESANKAGKDLEYFINRLKDIQSGFTYSSKNLIQSVNALKVLWEEAQEAESKKYKELRSAWDKLNDTHFYMDYKRVLDLTAEYNNLRAETEKLKDEYYSYTKTVIAGESQIIKENAEEVKSYRDIYNSVYRVRELQLDYLKNINSKIITDYLKEQIDFQSQYTQVLILEQMQSIQKGVISLYESLSSVGKNIGEKITSSIINGMDKSSFLQDMKAYFRENIIKFAVYTDEFQTRLAQIGARVGALFSGGFSSTFATIDSVLIKDELEAMYDETAETVKGIDKMLDAIFGTVPNSIEDSFDEAVEIVEEKLTTLEEVIKSFNEQIADVGGDLGSQFADSIAEGMSESDFLGKMKDWIKRMLVQSVVYTESMKAEIEAIGQAITKGIREGFSETGLHEIRRDLSWVFNEANETVASLDNILDRTFGGYAIGTNNALSGLHLVGEAGPELVRFRGGEQVLNANNTQKALEGIGGTTINQNVTFNNLQDTSAYAMMNQFKQYNRSLAINGVI